MASDDRDTIRREFREAVQRHLAQQPAEEDVGTSRWRYSLMNWGHDPLEGK